ncbi:ESPR-type extended signal peptide-containing protein, partial [Escherichia coli]
MNRIYRVIWNCTLQAFQACSELTRRVDLPLYFQT